MKQREPYTYVFYYPINIIFLEKFKTPKVLTEFYIEGAEDMTFSYVYKFGKYGQISGKV